MEFWATSHNDSVVVLLIALALVAAAKNRWTWAFVALSLAAGAKIWPILLFPLFIGWKRNRPLRWRQWSVLIPIAVLLALPYWTNVTENLQFMSGFMGGWRNNDSLYGLILWVTKDLYGAKYTAFAIVAVVVAFLTLREVPLERASLWAIAVRLMFSVEKRLTAVWRAAAAIRSCRRSSVSNCTVRAACASISPTASIKPSTPLVISSGTPPALVPMGGTPHAMASSAARPKASNSLGISSTWASGISRST